jgi:hypothetical protein
VSAFGCELKKYYLRQRQKFSYSLHWLWGLLSLLPLWNRSLSFKRPKKGELKIQILPVATYPPKGLDLHFHQFLACFFAPVAVIFL